MKIQNYTLPYSDNYHNNYPRFDYVQILCILGFILYNLLGYFNIDITFIIHNQQILNKLYIFGILIGIYSLIKIMTY